METEAGKRASALLLQIVKELVDDPDRAKVATVYGPKGKTIVLTATAAPSDIGKVIGKRGKTADMLRYLLEMIAAKHRIRLILEIDDGREGQARHFAQPTA